MGDRELIDRCSCGDRRAWSELFRRYDRRLLAILTRGARGIPGLDPADLRQEVWAKLVEKGALAGLRLGQPGALEAFLARVAARVALDHRRRRRKRPFEGTWIDIETPHHGADPEAEAMKAEQLGQLSAALRRIVAGPDSRRNLRVLGCYLHGGLGPTEIAACGVGLSTKGVASLLRRTLSKLAPGMASERPPAGTTPSRRGGVPPGTP